MNTWGGTIAVIVLGACAVLVAFYVTSRQLAVQLRPLQKTVDALTRDFAEYSEQVTANSRRIDSLSDRVEKVEAMSQHTYRPPSREASRETPVFAPGLRIR